MFLEFRERFVSKATTESKLTAGVCARGIKKATLAGQHPRSFSPRVSLWKRYVNPYQIIILNSHARVLTRTQFVRRTRAYQERKRDIRGPVTYAGWAWNCSFVTHFQLTCAYIPNNSTDFLHFHTVMMNILTIAQRHTDKGYSPRTERRSIRATSFIRR